MDITVEICTFCEKAAVEDGSLWIERSFDTIYSDRFPTELSSIWVALRIRFHVALSRRDPLYFRFHSPDGISLASIPVCSRKKGPTQPGMADSFCINLAQFILPVSGGYSAGIFSENKSIFSMPVYVKQCKESQVSVDRNGLN